MAVWLESTWLNHQKINLEGTTPSYIWIGCATSYCGNKKIWVKFKHKNRKIQGTDSNSMLGIQLSVNKPDPPHL